MTKIKSNCDQTQKLNFLQNLKSCIVKKSVFFLWQKIVICDENLKYQSLTKLKVWNNWNVQIGTKLKNSKYGKTQNLKLWECLKDQLKKIKDSYFYKTPKLKLWQN